MWKLKVKTEENEAASRKFGIIGVYNMSKERVLSCKNDMSEIQVDKSNII